MSPSWVTCSTAPSPSSSRQQLQKDNGADLPVASQLSSQRPNEELLPPLRAGALDGDRAREILLRVVAAAAAPVAARGKKARGKEEQQRGATSSSSPAASFASASDEVEGARVVEAREGLIEAASTVSTSLGVGVGVGGGGGGGGGGGSRKTASAAPQAAAAAVAAERHFDALATWVAREQRRKQRGSEQQWRRVRAVLAAVLMLASA